MRRVARFQARLLALSLCCAICGVVGTASGAKDTKAFRQRVGALRRENATLSRRMHSATLELYALESTLRRAEARLTSLSAERAEIARERQSIRMRLQASRHNLHASRRQVALLVHGLYEQQNNDPLAVVLGAESLDDAITTLDELGRSARQGERIAADSLEAQKALRALQSKLQQDDARVRRLELAAARTSASLTAAHGSRQRYISSLSAQNGLDTRQISEIDDRAQASVEASAGVRASPSSTPTPDPPTGARTFTVVATGYAMSGRTATGLPPGWGTVAVDPSVIPLGSRLTVPGYGDGVAADTGFAVQGATVDLWFPTVRQALAWGRRIVTITLH